MSRPTAQSQLFDSNNQQSGLCRKIHFKPTKSILYNIMYIFKMFLICSNHATGINGRKKEATTESIKTIILWPYNDSRHGF